MATMNTNIKINIVEPGSSTPVDPSDATNTTNTTTYTSSTDVSAPDTGLFTHGIGGAEATIIGSFILLVLSSIVLALLYRKHIKQGKVTKLVRIVDQVKTIVKSKKRITASLTALALLISIATLSTLLINTNKSNTNAIESTEGNESSEVTEEGNEESTSSLTLDVDSEELTIEVGDEPVFAVLPVKLTVEEATQAGYTLTAYTNSTDIVSTTSPGNKIPMVAINEEDLSEYTSLTDNTWGLSLTKPEDENSKVYTVLSTDADNPTMITDKDYEETRENDTITIYYGFYIAPGTPYGMYEGSAIYYETEAKRADLAKVIFDGNGKFYFDYDASITTNAISYMPGEQSAPQYSHTPNINDEGVQIEGEMYPLDSNETFVYKFDGMNNIYVDVVKTINDNYCGPDNDDYFSIWPGAHTNYTAKTNWETALSLAGSNGRNIFDNGGKYDGASVIIEGNAVTIAYTTSINRASHCVAPGYGYYAKVIGYNPNITVAGEYKKPVPDGAYKFLGWSEDPDATIPTYTAVADIERTLNLSPGNKITLYAISEPIFIVSYDGNDANADTSMDQAEQYTANLDGTSQVDLLASNFTRDGYGFVGWSTDAEAWRHLTDDDETNNPIIYGPNQTITIDDGIITEAGENRKLALNAVWAPAETTASGDPVLLQDWQGCSRLTATTYNSTTSALTVGKNTITALTDGRDGNIYTIARLADGNCWMTESLRFDNESELSLRNTNNPSLPLTNDYNTSTTSNFLSATSDSWCTEWESAPCYNQSKLNTNNTVSPAISPVFSQDFTNNAHDYIVGDLNVNMSYYGNYYNWYSATAGNGKYETSSNQVVAGDVCPAGWQLPYGGSGDANNGRGNTSGGFYYLNQKMGGNTSAQDASNWRSFPNNFTYSGLWSGLTTYSRGYAGYYWSSTADTAGGAYSLRFYYDYVDPTNGKNFGSKNDGFSVRCILSAE